VTTEPAREAERASSASAYLAEVAPVLWPNALSVESTSGQPSRGTSWVVVPGSSRPRLVLPAGSRRAAATVVRRYAEPKTQRARLRGAALALAFRSGLGERIFRDRLNVTMPAGGVTLADHVSQALGVPCSFGLHVGPARANRKPVLTLVSADGRLVGFAKLGVNELTKNLVRSETAALRYLAGAPFTRLVVPEALHAGEWEGTELLVQSALPVWQRRGGNAPAVRLGALLELAALDQGAARLVDSPFWRSTTSVLADLPTPAADALRASVAQIASVAVSTVRLGAWHGDWHSGNMAVVGRRLLVWDWERFAVGVPVGCDALHFELMLSITVSKSGPEKAVRDLILDAPRLLTPLGVALADVPLITAAYLLHLGSRYLRDDQARFGPVEEWLLPALADLSGSLAPARPSPSRGSS
jgi:hypothetical protein